MKSLAIFVIYEAKKKKEIRKEKRAKMFHSGLFVHPELLQDHGGPRRGTQVSDVFLLN